MDQMIKIFQSLQGEVLSLTAAVGWAFAVVLYKKSGERIHPIALNLGKNCIGALCFGLILFLVPENAASKTYLELYDSGALELLILSGILGIGIADTLFFWSLNLLGASFSAIIDCLIAPFIIILSFIFLNESLTLWQASGAGLIVFSILFAADLKRHSHLTLRKLWGGIALGTLAMAAMALGVIIMKPILNETSLIQVIFIRLLAGIFLLWINLLFLKNKGAVISALFKREGFAYTLAASFLGGFIVLLIWIAGYKFTQASIAAALNQLSNVFIFLFAAFFLKEHISRRKVASISMAVVGAFLVTFG